MDSPHEHIIYPYDPKWVDAFEEEVAKLKEVFGGTLLGIEHIGSTSVPGLVAKPVVDIMVLIDNHTDADRFKVVLKSIGYVFDANAQSTERHFFRKGNPTKYHLSVAYKDKGSFWERQLVFRDYLREHPGERDQYAVLKQKLIAEDPTGKGSYITDKTDFVNEILGKSGFIR